MTFTIGTATALQAQKTDACIAIPGTQRRLLMESTPIKSARGGVPNVLDDRSEPTVNTPQAPRRGQLRL